jgi:hypothetical protein
MEHRAVSRYVGFGAVVALSLLVAASPAPAQVTQPSPSAPGGGGLTAPPHAGKSAAGIVEGSVKKVDPAAHTVQISTGLFGILGRTLGVTDSTQIQVEGRQGTLSDLREGNKVRAAYEARDGKNVATLIEIMPAAEEDAAAASSPRATPGSRPPAPGAGMPGSSPGAGAPAGTKP